jgi:methyl-accepting chemotaxis protein
VDEALLDELYSAPLDEFVERRTALAKQLKADGRAEEAAEVSAARKPTVPVWTANQLARRNRPAVDKLLTASSELRKALGKGDREAFTKAQKGQADALRKLRDAARSLLGDPTDAALERVVATFRDASSDEELAARLAEGRLTEEPEPGGFDTLAGLAFAPAQTRETTPKQADGRGARRLAEARAALKVAKARQRELERTARQAEQAAQQARAAADKAGEEVARAEAAVEAAKR